MFQFPKPDERVVIIGATGSGKTRQGVWLHSFRDFRRYPNVMFDFKGDDLLARIDRARPMTLKETPKHPGLYIVRVMPHEAPELNEFLWRVWEREKTGVYIDEGYGIPNIGPNARAYNAILTQGRSKKIPIITLTQRPVYLSRFVFTESSYISVFRLQDRRDFDTIRGFVPNDNPVFDMSRPLPKFNSRWYDIGQDWACELAPVPNDDEILQRYDDALKLRTRMV